MEVGKNREMAKAIQVVNGPEIEVIKMYANFTLICIAMCRFSDDFNLNLI